MLAATENAARAIATKVNKPYALAIDFIAIIGALITTLLPKLLDKCANKNINAFCGIAEKPSVSQEFGLRVLLYSERDKLGGFSHAKDVADAMLECGKARMFDVKALAAMNDEAEVVNQGK